MTTEVIVSRHGEAHCNVAGLVGGDKTCTGLTDLGRKQAECLAARLRAEHDEIAPFDVLYASPRRRTRESAEIICDALGLPVRVADGLAGPRHGEADGRTWTDLRAEFGGAPRNDPDRPYAVGSETWNEYLSRVTGCIASLVRRHPGQRILLAGHHETIEASFTYMLGLPRDASTRTAFASGHTSLVRWHRSANGFGQEAWVLTAFNDQQHLAQAGLLPADRSPSANANAAA
ncbi:MAG: histidine phosphatase family protein [Streptosporangiaceae bacterium]